MSNTAPTFPIVSTTKVFRVIVQTNMNNLNPLLPVAGDNNWTLTALESFFRKADVGAFNSNTYITTGMAYASDVITFSSIGNNDTVTVNGRVYTAKTSGATGLQQFNIGGSDSAAATNFAAILNADTSTAVKGVVTGVASAATITAYCLSPGNIGLRCTASGTGGASAATANFTGGSEGTSGTNGHGL